MLKDLHLPPTTARDLRLAKHAQARYWREIEEALSASGVPLGMATAPQFAGTPAFGAALLSATADVNYTAPTQAVTVFTAGANGSKIDEILLQGVGTTVAGNINVFIYDPTSTNYYLWDSLPVTANAVTATNIPWRLPKQYANLILKGGWQIRATSTVASQPILVAASGGDF